MNHRSHNAAQPRRPVAVRKPLRPVHVAAVRQPIKVTKPISFGGGTLPARPAR